jgi:hypothetical protein
MIAKEGLPLDAACPAQIFISPAPGEIVKAAIAPSAGRGVLFIVKDYAGDRMDFEGVRSVQRSGSKRRHQDDVCWQIDKAKGAAALLERWWLKRLSAPVPVRVGKAAPEYGVRLQPLEKGTHRWPHNQSRANEMCYFC